MNAANATAETAQEVEVMPRGAPAPVVNADADSVMAVIGRLANDPNADIEKFERLMAMYERMEAHKAERAFNEAMAAAQAEMPQVVRDATNDHTKSRYARFESINKLIMPIITKHGFHITFGTEDSPHPGHHRVICTLAHKDGHSRPYHADLPADIAGSQGKANKTAIQGFGSTVSYGRRYLMLLIFNIALANEDNDGNNNGNGETITDKQAHELLDRLNAVNANIAKFTEYLKVESIDEIPASRYAEAERAVRVKEKQAMEAKP